jgi:site-specific DNA-methyltransferase (adenine-specific)
LGDCVEAAKRIEPNSVDLLVLDPPYNLNKKFGEKSFNKLPVDRNNYSSNLEWLQITYS